MTRKEAKQYLEDNSISCNLRDIHKLIDKIYDDFENKKTSSKNTVIEYDCNPCGYDYAIDIKLRYGQEIRFAGVNFIRGQHLMRKDCIGFTLEEFKVLLNNNTVSYDGKNKN